MKTTSADRYFSLAVRQRAGWKCERCGKEHAPGPGLDCAHFFGRGKWATRFDPKNAQALDRGCHQYFTAHPLEFVEWFEKRTGKLGLRSLKRCSQDVVLAKRARKEIREIAAFYKVQHECGTCNSYFEASR